MVYFAQRRLRADVRHDLAWSALSPLSSSSRPAPRACGCLAAVGPRTFAASYASEVAKLDDELHTEDESESYIIARTSERLHGILIRSRTLFAFHPPR